MLRRQAHRQCFIYHVLSEEKPEKAPAELHDEENIDLPRN